LTDEIINDILDKMAAFREQLRNNTFNREILADLDLLTQYIKDDIGGRLKLERDSCDSQIKNELEGQRTRIIHLETACSELEKRLAEKELSLRESENRAARNEREWENIDKERRKDLVALSEELKQMEENIIRVKKENENNKRLKNESEACVLNMKEEYEKKLVLAKEECKDVTQEKEILESKLTEKEEETKGLNQNIAELRNRLGMILQETGEREKKMLSGFAEREKEISAVWNRNMAALEKKYQELIEENAAGISLRLRSCVNSVSGVIQLISDKLLLIKNRKQKPEDEENVRKDLASTLLEVDTIAKAVKSYLELSRVPVMNIAEINIYESIKKVLNYYTEQIEKQNIKVVYNHDELVQNCIGDRETMQAILNDILQNAVEAMTNGGVLTISADSAVIGPGKYLKVSISDTGIGIDPRINDKIFLPFFTTKENGEGMGLSRVKRNMILNRGSIIIESKKDLGTVVHLTFYKGKLDA